MTHAGKEKRLAEGFALLAASGPAASRVAFVEVVRSTSARSLLVFDATIQGRRTTTENPAKAPDGSC